MIDYAAAVARPRATKRVRIDAEALTKVGASEFLALDEASMRSVALAPEPSAKPGVVGGIGVMRIDGPLAQRAEADLCGYVDGYDAIASRYAAVHASDADSVLVVIDSPGGDVAGIEECIRRMQETQQASGKPVVVHVDELAASAAYWIASAIATNGIYAPVAGRVGSIGCIGCNVDESEALKQAGVSVTLVRAPDGKAESHPAGPIAELAEKRLRAGVERIASRFFASVASSRPISVEDVKALNGAVLDAPEALRRKLIDGVQGLDSSVAVAAEMGAARRREMEKKVMSEQELTSLRAEAASYRSENESLKAQIGAAVEVAGVKSAAELAGKIEALKTANAALQANATRIAEIEAMLAAQAEEKRQAEIVALVDAAVAERKVAPAQRADLLAKAQKHGAEYVRDVVAAIATPIVHGPDSAPKAAVVTDAKLDAELVASLKKAGLSEDDFKAYGPVGSVEG